MNHLGAHVSPGGAEVVTVQEDTLIEEAIKVMAEKGFKRIPVVGDDGKFKGMISRDAVLRLGGSE